MPHDTRDIPLYRPHYDTTPIKPDPPDSVPDFDAQQRNWDSVAAMYPWISAVLGRKPRKPYYSEAYRATAERDERHVAARSAALHRELRPPHQAKFAF